MKEHNFFGGGGSSSGSGRGKSKKSSTSISRSSRKHEATVNVNKSDLKKGVGLVDHSSVRTMKIANIK